LTDWDKGLGTEGVNTKKVKRGEKVANGQKRPNRGVRLVEKKKKNVSWERGLKKMGHRGKSKEKI